LLFIDVDVVIVVVTRDFFDVSSVVDARGDMTSALRLLDDDDGGADVRDGGGGDDGDGERSSVGEWSWCCES
jgi:hypothetical protein